MSCGVLNQTSEARQTYLDVVAAYAAAARRSSADSLSLSLPPEELELSSVALGLASGSGFTVSNPFACWNMCVILLVIKPPLATGYHVCGLRVV